MKRLSVIIFTLFIIVNFFGTDRWGSSSSYSSGKAIGTTRSVGVDPNGGMAYIYDSTLLKTLEQGTRQGIALGYVNNGEFLFDLAQCEDQYFPLTGDPLIVMFAKTQLGSDGFKHGYYGAVSMIKDNILHDDPINPEYMNDMIIYEIPKPSVTTDRKNNYITWSKPTIQPIGNQDGNPFAGYNIYFAAGPDPDPGNPPSKLNSATISFQEPGYTDSVRDGYYFITLVTGSGVELANWDVGPDGRPGVAGKDDNLNGITDEAAEIGFAGSDDIYIPTYSAPSNHVTYTTQEDPVAVKDLSIVNSNNKIYLQWSSVGDTVSKYNIYKSDTESRWSLIGSTKYTIYVDTGVKSTPYYRVTSVTDDSNESLISDSNTVQANPFNGLADYANFSNGDNVLFPAWSNGTPPFLTTAGIAYFKSQDGRGGLFLADLKGNTWNLNDALQIYWASTISWGDFHNKGADTAIFFTAIDGNGHSQIYVQNADPGHQNDYAPISQGWGNWTDPDWTDSLNQVSGTNMLACSIDGDIYVFDPDNNDFEHGNLMALTDFFDPTINNYGDTDMCFQPKWSPDNTALAFIVRHMGAGTSIVASDIYIVPDVQQLIKDVDSGNPITSLDDTRLEKTTETHAPDRFLPIWAPSWSNDSTMISYAVDVSNKFNNYAFSQDYTQAGQVLAATNFDAYTYERGIGTWTSGMPEMNTSDSEGFVSWAPKGGDRFFYTKIDFAGGTSTIEQFIDPTIYGESGSGRSVTAKKFETATDITISDRDFTSIEMSKDVFAKAGTIGIYPIEKYPKLPYLYDNIGSMRTFLIGGKKKLDIPVKIRIHYTRYQAKGNEENFLFPMRYNEDTKSWENIYSFNIVKDEDGNPLNDDKDGGFIDLYTDNLGTIGIFSSYDEGDEDDDEVITDIDKDKIKIGPNPASELVKFIDVPRGTLIKIYNLEGSLIASSKNNNSLTWVADHFEWVVKNDKNLSVASGIYLVAFRYNGKSVTKKLAIIK